MAAVGTAAEKRGDQVEAPAAARDRAEIRRVPFAVAVVASLAVLVLIMAVSVSVGPLRISLPDVARILGSQFGIVDADGLTQRDISVVLHLRVPRTVLGAIVGAALAISGAALQSLFTNPLADPGIIGVTGGASTGAVAMIVLVGSGTGAWLVPLGAFAAGVAVTALIYLLARPGRAAGTARMLLVGIAVGSGCQAVTGFFTYVADDAQLQTLTFWQMGTLGKVTGPQVLAVIPVFVTGLIVLLACSRWLDVLTLGERQAQHLGVDVPRARAIIVISSALLVGAAVSFAGSIGFVGLVVPHIVRQLVGPAHRTLLPLAALTGAILVVAADCAARTLNPPSEIPIGLFTALVGVPFFLSIILKNRKASW